MARDTLVASPGFAVVGDTRESYGPLLSTAAAVPGNMQDGCHFWKYLRPQGVKQASEWEMHLNGGRCVVGFF